MVVVVVVVHFFNVKYMSRCTMMHSETFGKITSSVNMNETSNLLLLKWDLRNFHTFVALFWVTKTSRLGMDLRWHLGLDGYPERAERSC